MCCFFFLQLMAVYEEQEAQQRGVANTSMAPSPDLYQAELSVFQPITGGEIEVNSSALKSSESFLFYVVFMLKVPPLLNFSLWWTGSHCTCSSETTAHSFNS